MGGSSTKTSAHTSTTTTRLTNRQWIGILCAATLVGCIVFGAWYLFGGYQTGATTTWDIQAILEDDEVVTLDDFRSKLWVDDIEDFDSYLAYRYEGDPRSEAIAKFMSTIEIEWKGESRDLSRCQQTFGVRGAHPMEIQRIAPWTDGQGVTVFCDEQGRILGWAW